MNSITAIGHNIHRPQKTKDELTEEERVHRQLVNEVMSRFDFDEARANFAQERKRSNDSRIARSAGGLKPTAYVPPAELVKSKIKLILLDLKATEEKDSLRMRQIEMRLAELDAKDDNCTTATDVAS